MKTILSLLLFLPFFIFSQEDEALEREAEFPGGIEAMKEFLRESVLYPEMSLTLGVQGTVIVEFVVNKDGSIEQINVLQSVSREIDEEAMRVVGEMPNWTPAIYKGEIVRVRCKIPIKFSFYDDEKKYIFDYPEKAAQFPKGNIGLNKYLTQNSKYSFVTFGKAGEGELEIEFVVNKDGSIEQVKLLKGVSEEMDKEVLKLIAKMPNWKPAKQNKKKVRSRVRLPIHFELSEGN